jgi:hypothetical protein
MQPRKGFQTRATESQRVKHQQQAFKLGRVHDADLVVVARGYDTVLDGQVQEVLAPDCQALLRKQQVNNKDDQPIM